MRIAVALAALVALAGCASDDPPVDPGNGGSGGPGPSAMADPEVFNATGTIDAGVGGIVATFQLGGDALPVTVDANATLLLAELTWDSDAFALDLCISSPSAGDTQGVANCDTFASGGTLGAPARPLVVELPGPEVGEWHVRPVPSTAAADTTFAVAVTVFYGETAAPEGYSALPPA